MKTQNGDEQSKLDVTIRLSHFIEKCYHSGVITRRQYMDLQGAGADTDPSRIIHVLTRLR